MMLLVAPLRAKFVDLARSYPVAENSLKVKPQGDRSPLRESGRAARRRGTPVGLHSVRRGLTAIEKESYVVPMPVIDAFNSLVMAEVPAKCPKLRVGFIEDNPAVLYGLS